MASRCSDTVRLRPDTTYESSSVVTSAFRRSIAVVVSAFRPTVMVAASIALALPLLAQQADRARTEALARQATERLQSLQKEADRLASEERTLLGDLRKLELDQQIKAEEMRQVEAEHARAAAELTATNERVHQLQEQELAALPDLRARLVEIYKLGQGRYLRLLLSTSDLRRVGQASRMVAELAKLDHDRIASHQHTLDELKTVQTTLEERNRRIESLTADARRAQAAADRAAQARADLIRDIDRRRDLNAQLAGELQGAQQKLQLALRDLANGVAAVAPAVLPLGPFRGELDWPVAGSIRRRFARTAAAGLPLSNGIEIVAEEGAPVLAVHDGVVAFADTFAGFGNLVILDHGSQTFSLYGNLLVMAVKKGARIEHGQALGTVGSSTTGPAGLYFQLSVDGQPVDPLQWLKKR